MTDELMITLVCVFTFLMLILIFMMIYKIKLEKEKLKDDILMDKDEVLPYDLFIKFINKKIERRKGNQYFSLFWLDIDNFIEISENYNEKAIDELLNEMIDNIKRVLPRGVKLGYGPRIESILIYLSELYTEDEMNKLAKQIKLSSEIKVKIFEDMMISKTTTVSYATYPLHGQKAEILIEALKTAIYLAENSGGNMIRPYSKDMSKDKAFIDKYYELKQAIQKREFYFVYQPIIKISTGKIVGFESLLRWQHPTKGTISPHEFIKELESSGDINWIGTWGLETLVKTMTDFKRENQQDYMWHLNISLRQLLNQKVVNEFQRIVSKYRVDPKTIVLELNDFGTNNIQDETVKTILKLKNIGFKLAVDILNIDFQLANKIELYQMNVAKINKSFYKVPEEVTKDKFVEILNELQEKQKLVVIAEHVENKEMEQRIINKKFDYAQGYYYFEPLSKNDALNEIKKQ